MKKINKYVKYMVFAVILCIVTTGNVFASCKGEKNACVECEYSFKYLGQTPKVTLKAVDDGSGNIVIKNKTLGGNKSGFELADVNVYGSSFKPTAGKKLICPTLYYDVVEPQNTGQPGASEENKKIDISTQKEDASEILTKKVVDQSKIDLNKDDKDSGGITFGDGDHDCKYVLGQILDDIQNIFDIVKILAPILVIVFGTLDFVKATIAMDEKGMKTAMNKFPRRLIAAAALFFLPYIINLLLSLPGLEIENAVCGISKVVFKLW